MADVVEATLYDGVQGGLSMAQGAFKSPRLLGYIWNFWIARRGRLSFMERGDGGGSFQDGGGSEFRLLNVVSK